MTALVKLEAPDLASLALTSDPINHIVWRRAAELRANGWNPNYVMGPEMVLLEFSLLKTGWLQPILISRDDIIIDGFHRWRLSLASAELMKRYRGCVPVSILDIPPHEARMLTVRINRAKGTHGAVEMSNLVRMLIDEDGCDPQEVARGIGATSEEVALLYQADIFKSRNLDKYQFSKAWVPAESGKGNPGGAKGAAMSDPKPERDE